MPILGLVEARVLINGQPAAEFEDPDSPDETYCAPRYILAEPKQTYSVDIRVLRGFTLYQASYLQANLRCDAAGRGRNALINTDFIPREGQIVAQDSQLYHFEQFPAKDPKSGKWYEYKWAFGSLERSKCK